MNDIPLCPVIKAPVLHYLVKKTVIIFRDRAVHCFSTFVPKSWLDPQIHFHTMYQVYDMPTRRSYSNSKILQVQDPEVSCMCVLSYEMPTRKIWCVVPGHLLSQLTILPKSKRYYPTFVFYLYDFVLYVSLDRRPNLVGLLLRHLLLHRLVGGEPGTEKVCSRGGVPHVSGVVQPLHQS